MELRDPETADTQRVRELVESAMTTSYALSPQQIDALLEDEFGSERLTQRFESSDSVMYVAESSVSGEETTIGGFAEALLDDHEGEVRWLFVDPEHRGKGLGTQLFETTVESIREQEVDRVIATTLEANREGDQFFERFGFERTNDRRMEVAGESLVEHMYAESPTDAEPPVESETGTIPDADLPNTEMVDDAIIATTDDGQQVYINREEDDSGTERPFFVVYTNEEHTEEFGYYCANCGSLDTVMDNTGRIECSNCSNTHAERSDEAYDDSYI